MLARLRRLPPRTRGLIILAALVALPLGVVAARALSRLMLARARRWPELSLRDVTFEAQRPADPEAATTPTLAIDALELAHARGGIQLDGGGRLALEQAVPFQLDLDYGLDDRLTGRMWFGVPDSTRGALDTLTVRVDGTMTQDRRHGALEVHDPTRVWIGSLPLRLGGRVKRRVPRLSLTLAADSLTGPLITRSTPAPLLGPPPQPALEGSFDYRLAP